MFLSMASDKMIFDAMKLVTRPTLVVVCGWCGDAAKTARAKAQGFVVSHGMCSSCSARLLEAFNKE